MPVEIVAAIIGGVAVVTAAIIAAISKKPKSKYSNSVKVGGDVNNTTITMNGKTRE